MSLAPLVITPELAARTRVDDEATSQPSGEEEPVNQLQAMFPDYDKEVLNSVFISCDSNIEETIQQLLEMGGQVTSRDSAEGFLDTTSATFDSDEQLALALFKQFAEDLSNQLQTPIPPEVRDDPQRYEAFVREQFERELQSGNSDVLTRHVEQLFRNAEQSPEAATPANKAGFLDRVKKMPSLWRPNRLGMVAVTDGSTPLLAAEETPERI